MSTARRTEPGLLLTMLDATFSTLLTVRLVRLLHLLALIVVGTVAFVLLFASFAQGIVSAILAVVVVPALALLAIAMIRVVLEAVVVLFRMGEHVEQLSATLYTLSTHLRSTSDGDPGAEADPSGLTDR